MIRYFLMICFLFSAFITNHSKAQLVTAQELWTARYNNDDANSGEFLNSMTTDASGNIYVTGYSYDAVSDNDILTIKYNSSGSVEWIKRYNNSPVNGADYGNHIEVDPSGNVYVAGSSTGSANLDFITIKYDASGNELWTARYDGTGNNGDSGSDLAVDDAGNVYVTGGITDINNNRNYFTVKYNSSGTLQWSAEYDGPETNGYDFAVDVAVDDEGNVYVAGSSSGQNGDQDAATVKYNSSGSELWVKRYGGSDGDFATVLETDGSGYVYITGETTADSRDFFTIKYNALTGDEEWIALYDGALNDWDSPFDLKLDGYGNVIVTGQSAESNSLDYATVKYNSSGVLLWSRSFDYNGNNDIARSLAVDASGNIYVTGEIEKEISSSDKDIFTIRYSPQGILMWTALYDGPAGGSDIYSYIDVDQSGNVIVSGNSEGSGTSYDYITIKYEQEVSITAGIQDIINEVQSLPLSEGIKNSLISKLQNALKKYNSGDFEVVVNQLSAFLNQLNDLAIEGYLTDAQHQSLINKTTIVLNEINSMLPKTNTLPAPAEFVLHQNYPNPFNPGTVIKYSVPELSAVTIKIFSSLGEEIKILLDEIKPAGTYEINWNAADLPGGIYFYRMQAGSFVETRKMILMK